MSDRAAIQATFCGFRTLGGRKQLALTFEVPVEHSEQVLKVLGSPDPVNPQWVAIARLNLSSQGAQAPVPHRNDGIRAPKNVRRRFEELTYAEQAALKGTDKVFQRFLYEKHMIRDEDFEAGGVQAEDAAATAVRVACGVNSRADILPDSPAGAKWCDVLRSFEAWKNI